MTDERRGELHRSYYLLYESRVLSRGESLRRTGSDRQGAPTRRLLVPTEGWTTVDHNTYLENQTLPWSNPCLTKNRLLFLLLSSVFRLDSVPLEISGLTVNGKLFVNSSTRHLTIKECVVEWLRSQWGTCP